MALLIHVSLASSLWNEAVGREVQLTLYDG
jgi:hypothetical protein